MTNLLCFLIAAMLALLPAPLAAQSTIPNFPITGPSLISGDALNVLVAAVNNIQGNGTAGKGAFTTLTVSGAATFSSTVTIPAAGLTVGSTTLSEAELGVLDAVTPGTAAASKALILSAGGAIATVTSATITTLTSTTTNVSGHINTGGTPPVLTACGTSPAITGSDTAGIVTMGTGTPTGCVITFAAAYTGTPYCVVSWIATPLASQSYVTSNTAITLTQSATSSNKVQYVCAGPSGG